MDKQLQIWCGGAHARSRFGLISVMDHSSPLRASQLTGREDIRYVYTTSPPKRHTLRKQGPQSHGSLPVSVRYLIPERVAGLPKLAARLFSFRVEGAVEHSNAVANWHVRIGLVLSSFLLLSFV